jgi:hypothetical protein
MELKKFKLTDLKVSEYNPPNRTRLAGKMNSLVKSMNEIGQQCPILITEDLRIVDGHRRFAGAKQLGWESIAAVVVNTDEHSAEQIYAQVNSSSLHMTGADVMHLYIVQPEALTASQRKSHEKAEDVVGRKVLLKLQARHLGIKVFKTAVRCSKYCDRDGDEGFIRSCVYWIIKYGTTRLRNAMDMQTPASEVAKAVSKRMDLLSRFQATEKVEDANGVED